METRRIAAATLGCKLNQYETEAVVGQFLALGWHSVPVEEEADLVLVDTCTVTDRADQKARHLVRQIIRRNPLAVVVVMGCYSQAAAEELARIPGVDYIVGTGEKRALAQRLGEPEKQAEAVVMVARPGGREDRELLALDSFQRQTRAWLKIQDGCDVFCSFCIIPFTRGRSRSMLPEAVLEQARRLLDGGFVELVLTGVHMGDYGRDLDPPRSLAWLCARLLELPGLRRLRLSSIEPWDITDELLATMAADARFCPHLHTALQSGSDEILSAMGRRIDVGGIQRLFERVDHFLPGAGLGSDLICGFPGETERHAEETFRLVEASPLGYLHVFPYSRRSGTKAAKLPDQLPVAEKKARCRELLELGQRLQAKSHAHALGQVAEVLLEHGSASRPAEGPTILYGYTPDYLRVECTLPDHVPVQEAAGRLLPLRLVEDAGEHLRGEWTAFAMAHAKTHP